jgi:acyl-coenzyme A thioesterase PaaI-like protein
MDNDPDDNPCFACGPRNPVGLRMRFFDDGDAVRSELTLDDRYCGYTGTVLQGILYSAMDDAIFWCAYARFGIMGTSDMPARVEADYLGSVRTGAPFLVEARRVGERAFEARCVQDGKDRAALRMRLRPWSAEELARGAKDPRLPRSIRAEAQRAVDAGAG